MCGVRGLSTILAIALIVIETSAKPPQRIIGGTLATSGEFPYQVAIRHRGSFLCGGAIISDRHVLTAAHCVSDKAKPPHWDLRVATGTVYSMSGQTHSVKAIYCHEKYDDKSANAVHDIAIIELQYPITFNKYQNKVELPTKATPDDVSAVATGWGFDNMKSPAVVYRLKKVSLYTLNHAECRKSFHDIRIQPSQLCTYHYPGYGVCHGDSGGPLVYDDVLVGIVSFGIPCGLGIPDVFSNVYYYLDWINKTIKN